MALALLSGLLIFYLLILGITKLKPFNTTPKLLLCIHQSSLGVMLLLLAGYLGLGISLRGSYLDPLPVAVAWLAAAGYFVLHREQLRWPSKLYFGSWFIWPVVLASSYLLDGIIFALVSAPVLGLLPSPAIYRAPECTIRQFSGGLLSAPRIELLTPFGFVLERHRGTASQEYDSQSSEVNLFQNVLSAQVQPSVSSDSTVVLINTAHHQYRVLFRR